MSGWKPGPPTIASLIADLQTYSPDAEVTSATVKVKIGKLRSTLSVSAKMKAAVDATHAAKADAFVAVTEGER